MYRVDASVLSSAMDRIERWFAEHVDPGYFQPGRADGVEPLHALHARWDGQRGDVPFYDGFTLLGVDEAAAERAMMDKLARDEDWSESWWSPHWQPFGADGMGQLLVVDVLGGQVLEFLHDDETRPLVAESLEAFFTTYATQLETGERILKDGYLVDPVEQAAMQARLEAAHQSRRNAQAERERKSRPILLAIFAAVLVMLLVFWWLDR